MTQADSSSSDTHVTQAVPFFAVADMVASLTFYMEGLSFTIAQKWEVDGRIRWCRLERGGAALMLQQFPTEGHDAWVPEAKVGEGVSVCFFCEDAVSIYRAARRRGLSASRPMVGNAMWVTSLADPDGYAISFQSTTDTAEETMYTEGD